MSNVVSFHTGKLVVDSIFWAFFNIVDQIFGQVDQDNEKVDLVFGMVDRIIETVDH